MKYFINNKVGVMFRKPEELKKEDYSIADVDSDNIYAIERNGELEGFYDLDGLYAFLSNISATDNIVIALYYAGDVYKLATLIITGDKAIIKLHTYAYNCFDLITLYEKYVKVSPVGDAYYDIKYLVDGVEFKARFENINDLGVMIDELDDKNIIQLEMFRDNELVAAIKYFDDIEDIFTIEVFKGIATAAEFIDLFEEYLR